jgi:hypothetical protein
MAIPQGVTMIEDITDEQPRMSSTEAFYRTERQSPNNIRGVRDRTKPEFYKQSGMLGHGSVSGQGFFEGYIPGASTGAGGNALYAHAYSGNHQYPGAMTMNYSSNGVAGDSTEYGGPAGNYGTYTENVLEDTGVVPALSEHYSSANCVDVANHASNCPVCSQLYSKDNTVMYVIIGVLVLIIILLFVKLLDCSK